MTKDERELLMLVARLLAEFMARCNPSEQRDNDLAALAEAFDRLRGMPKGDA